MSFYRAIGSFAAVAIIAASPPAASAQQSGLGPEVHIDSGGLRGAPRDDRGVLSFKGIPYASPPIGALRWRAPQPAAPWTGVRDASQFGDRCLSALEHDPEPGPPRSENCLSLNVWTGARTAADKRPVMVWIHGGGFQFGSSANPTTNGSKLAQKGVVVVSLNYRLGVLGFLAHPDLDREGPSGDYGLQDQLAAIRWVKANIASFGGDPNNVTVFGESAGAHAIGILMASPLSKGLFQKAIGESGAFWDGAKGPLETYKEAHARGVAFAKRMGAASIADLRAMPAKQLNAAASWNFTRDPIVTAFSPNVDGFVVPETPAARFAKGEQLHIPLLAGWNGAEQWPFGAFALPHKNAQEFRDAAARQFGKDKLAEFLRLYPAGTDAEAKTSAEQLDGDMTIAEQTWAWLEFQRRTGHSPVYAYKLTYTSPYVPVASHLVDVPFVFGTLTPQFIVGSKQPPTDADRKLSDSIMSYWVNFAATGNPNGEGLPRWPILSGTHEIEDFGDTIQTTTNPQLARLRFLSGFRAQGVFPDRWRHTQD